MTDILYQPERAMITRGLFAFYDFKVNGAQLVGRILPNAALGTLGSGCAYNSAGVAFDGTTSAAITQSARALDGVTTWTLYCVLNNTASAGAQYMYAERNSALGMACQMDFSANLPRLLVRDDANVLRTAAGAVAFSGSYAVYTGHRNGNTITIYRNGISQATVTGTIGTITVSTASKFGQSSFDTSGSLSGTFAGASFHNVAHTLDEIAAQVTFWRGLLSRRGISI